MKEGKVPYICGPLTELSEEMAEIARTLYLDIAGFTEIFLGQRAFVPHEHFDPLVNKNATAEEVYLTESKRIRRKTSLLIVVAIAPSWGGGAEIQLANESKVPILILKPAGKNISRYILGMPNVVEVVEFTSGKNLEKVLTAFFENSAQLHLKE